MNIQQSIIMKENKQMELDFTSECPTTARELGIRWNNLE